jgi:hypothetical protein
MNLSGLNDHFVNGHALSDGYASGISGLTPDKVTACKMPFLNPASINMTVTGYTAFTLRDLGPTGVPYVGVKYVTEPGGGGWTIATITHLPFKVTNTTGASWGTLKLFTFPFGLFTVRGGLSTWSRIDWSDTTLTSGGSSGISATGSGDWGIGSTATADATISGTDVDFVASTAFLAPFVAGIGTSNVGGPVVNSATVIDGSTTTTSATAKTMNLNVIVDDTSVSDAETDLMFLTGVLRFRTAWQGDF